jgi:hypothetical protein
MLRRDCGQLLSRGSSLLREGGCFLALRSERLCGLRGLRLLDLRSLLRPRLRSGLIGLGVLLKRQFCV